MKFIPGEGREEGLGSPLAASFKLWGRADGSCQCFLYMQILFLKAKMQARNTQAGFACRPGGGVVLQVGSVQERERPGSCWLPGCKRCAQSPVWAEFLLLTVSHARSSSRSRKLWNSRVGNRRWVRIYLCFAFKNGGGVLGRRGQRWTF